MTDAAVSEVEEFGPDYFQDPLGFFARVREEGPVVPVQLPDGGQYWLITRYADVRAALADPRLHKDWTASDRAGLEARPGDGFLNRHMLNADPPDHTRLRRLVQKAFTPGRVAALRPRIEAITASLLDAMARLAGGHGRGRPDRRVRVPAADDGDLRAARRARSRPGGVRRGRT